MSKATKEKTRRLGIILFALFAFALLMGPGPGILIINPDPADPDATRFLLGMPIVYVWAVFWLGVQGLCVTLAYLFIWRKSDA